jgi:hypothetical protein
VRSFRHNRRGDRIIPTDSHSHQHSHTKDPDHLERRARNLVRQANDKYGPNDTDYQLLAIYKLSSELIAEKSKAKLSENVSYVGCSVNKAPEKRGIVRRFVCETSPVSGRRVISQYQRSYFRICSLTQMSILGSLG